MVVTAESCTGGLLAARLTATSGSSLYLERGFVTYTNASKTEMLNVPPAMIEEYGAVSTQVAEAMAKGALEKSNAHIAVSVTGIAGPTGGTKDKPVGLVFIGIATWEKTSVYEHDFTGDRASVRKQSVDAALDHLTKALT